MPVITKDGVRGVQDTTYSRLGQDSCEFNSAIEVLRQVSEFVQSACRSIGAQYLIRSS